MPSLFDILRETYSGTQPTEEQIQANEILARQKQSEDPLWKKLGRAGVDVITGGLEGLLGVEPKRNISNAGPAEYANIAGQLLQSGLPFGAYKSILPKGNIFHGTQKMFDKFDPSVYDKSDTLGWMTHFAEDPAYASKYAMGAVKGGSPIDVKPSYMLQEPIKPHALNWMGEKIAPRLLVAEPEAKNVLDLVDPNIDDLSQVLASFSPERRARYIRDFKQSRQIAELSKRKPKLMGPLGQSRHYPEGISPEEYPVRSLAEILRLEPGQLERTPFDAIRYRDIGERSWAIPESTPIRSAYGAELSDVPRKLEVIRTDPSITGGGELTLSPGDPKNIQTEINRLKHYLGEPQDAFDQLTESLSKLPSGVK